MCMVSIISGFTMLEDIWLTAGFASERADFCCRKKSRRDLCVVDDFICMASRIVICRGPSSGGGVSANAAKLLETAVDGGDLAGGAVRRAIAIELRLRGAVAGHYA